MFIEYLKEKFQLKVDMDINMMLIINTNFKLVFINTLIARMYGGYKWQKL